MDFLRLFQHLLPDGRAWRTTTSKKLRQFFEGLAGLPASIKTFVDQNFRDIMPGTTTEVSRWEDQFGLRQTVLTDQERRDRLAATWAQLVGAQDPRYLQDALQAAGFDVYVHEYWEPVEGRPTGGSVGRTASATALTFENTALTFSSFTATATARDPFLYLWDGVSDRQYVGCGHASMACGGDSAYAGAQVDPPGYALVNKLPQSTQVSTGCGQTSMVCGGEMAACASATIEYGDKQYQLPTDPDTWPYFLYIGGETFPDLATVPSSRKEEFEELCLRICPTQQWLGMLITYS